MSELDGLLVEYWKKFGDSFPIAVVGYTDEECISEIKKCLETGEPYVFDYEDGMIY